MLVGVGGDICTLLITSKDFMDCSLSHPRSLQHVSSRLVLNFWHNFINNHTHTHTQTKANENITSTKLLLEEIIKKNQL